MQEGIRLAQEFVAEAQQYVQGIYLMPSFGRYEMCGEILDALTTDNRPGAHRLDVGEEFSTQGPVVAAATDEAAEVAT
jgi:hypothetical protein